MKFTIFYTHTHTHMYMYIYIYIFVFYLCTDNYRCQGFFCAFLAIKKLRSNADRILHLRGNTFQSTASVTYTYVYNTD